jgi:hypothetical protein
MSADIETADGYARVIASSGRWRVVRCRDDLQFIVQKRRRGTAPRPWRAEAYVYDVSKLSAVLKRPSTGIPADYLAGIIAQMALAV